MEKEMVNHWIRDKTGPRSNRFFVFLRFFCDTIDM